MAFENRIPFILKHLSIGLFIALSSCNSGTVLDKKFEFCSFYDDFQELENLSNQGEISKADLQGIYTVAIEYQDHYAYRLEDKTYKEIVSDLSIFKSQGGFVKIDFGEVMLLESKLASIIKEEEQVKINLILESKLATTGSFEIILVVEDIIGNPKTIYLYENVRILVNEDKSNLGLAFWVKHLLDSIGSNSRIDKLDKNIETILKAVEFKVFVKPGNGNNDSMKLAELKQYYSPDCGFSFLVGFNSKLDSDMKTIAHNVKLEMLTCE